ncbi:hypothetical protein [Sphingomonas qomolangmaensis]|uniref:Uncharacterized protein n=1 Tax=Sphingomonas qomolangmaensis TaxID=2918765 RepID=A0ABY5L8Z1_9SPHN|nr:hypothetical protein [Sphingomonas qomolangmaensis]UUL83435.1 hypothetical protein NMP03_04185 [Sphingomonas qomolangmaensis]
MIAGMALALLASPAPEDDPQHNKAAVLASATASGVASSVALAPASGDFEPIERQQLRDAIAAFRVTGREARVAETLRIASSADGALDPMPGDRILDISNLDYRQQRRGAPSAAVDARMSMRLDPGQRSDPDFAMGGIGGALMRVTSALID